MPSTFKFFKEYECPQFGNVHARKFSLLEARVRGSGWRFEYMDDVESCEYALTLIPDLKDGPSITLWFTDPMSRKEFMLSMNPEDTMEQNSNGMAFDHLEVQKNRGKFNKFVRNFFGLDR